jgi:hypothetical protein
MVFRYGRCYSHGGIVTKDGPLMIVHAYAPARMVVEDSVACNPELCAPLRKPKFYSVWS